MTISKTQRQHLKQMSQRLQPVILLGIHGVTDKVHAEIERALYDHELIKIKLNTKDKADKKLLADLICQKHNAALIMQIGHVITIFKKSDKHR